MDKEMMQILTKMCDVLMRIENLLKEKTKVKKKIQQNVTETVLSMLSAKHPTAVSHSVILRCVHTKLQGGASEFAQIIHSLEMDGMIERSTIKDGTFYKLTNVCAEQLQGHTAEVETKAEASKLANAWDALTPRDRK
jgi:hypothetical protein